MVRIIFSYDQEDIPRAEVIVSNGEKEIKLAPIIDSGAHMTVIPQEIGWELGLASPKDTELKELEEEKLSGADGNRIDYVIRNINIKIDEFGMNVCWLFNSPNAHFLLGRDIFDDFDILFKQNPHKKVIFESDKDIL